MAIAEIRGFIHDIRQPESLNFGNNQSVDKQEIIIREPKTGDKGKDQFIGLEAYGAVVQQLQGLQLHMEVMFKITIGGGLSTPNQQYPLLKAYNRLKILEVNVLGQQAPQQQGQTINYQGGMIQQPQQAPHQQPQQVPAFNSTHQQPIQQPPRQAANVHPMQQPVQGQTQQQQGPNASTFVPPAGPAYGNTEDDIPF